MNYDIKFKLINDWIYYIEFKCRWFNIIIVNCYALTEEKSEEVKNSLYDKLDRICDGIPSGKPKIIIDDLMQRLKEKRYTIYLLEITVTNRLRLQLQETW
jgi:hypothetical protein